MTPLQPVLQSPVLAPAFDTVVRPSLAPSGLKYFLKSPKIAVIPLIVMTPLCVLVPAAISQTSVLLIPAGGLPSLLATSYLKRKIINNYSAALTE